MRLRSISTIFSFFHHSKFVISNQNQKIFRFVSISSNRAVIFQKFHRSLPPNRIDVLIRFSSTKSTKEEDNSSEMKDLKPQPVMKLESETFRSIFTPELEFLAELFKKYNYEIRIAGGAVRDLLMGIVPADYDFATTATPQQMQELFTKEQVRMLNKKGEKHGTVTCRINDKENFEVTTLRIDVACDGRHAEVEFTTDWFKDASRRDLTVNAMFLDLDGNVYDYYNGVEDLKKKRIAFVGNAEERIREDYLRILRYFRFYGRLSVSPDDHEQETLDAIKRTAQGLEGISGERLWVELKKIVVGRFAGPIMRRMAECGVTSYLGLPATLHLDEFERALERTAGLDPKPMTLIPALVEDESDINALDRRCKISSAERLLGIYVVNQRYDDSEEDETAVAKRFKDTILQEAFRPSAGSNASERIFEFLKYQGKRDLLESLRQWSLSKPVFPVNGDVLISKSGLKAGKRLRDALDHLFEYWKKRDYECSQEELLDELERWRSEKRAAGDRTPSPPLQKKKGRTAT